MHPEPVVTLAGACFFQFVDIKLLVDYIRAGDVSGTERDGSLYTAQRSESNAHLQGSFGDAIGSRGA